jgi:hypothetical protein
MPSIGPRILNVLDRIAHPSTTGVDLDQSIDGLRRLLHGEMPSEVLRPPPVRVKHRSYDACQMEIADLREKLAHVEAAKLMSEREKARQVNSLIEEITKLQVRLDQQAPPDATRDVYPHAEVIQSMVKRFGKHHGVPAALAERNARLYRDDPAIGRITASMMQGWRKQDRYPAYVVEQINSMTADDLPGRRVRWSEEERLFLVQLYHDDPRRSNMVLAERCSVQFGRPITECSIKGELDRLRKSDRVPPYRRPK